MHIVALNGLDQNSRIEKKSATHSWVGWGVPGALFLWTGWFAFALLTLESDADLDRLSSPPEWLDLLELIDLVVEPLLVGFRGVWLGLKRKKQTINFNRPNKEQQIS